MIFPKINFARSEEPIKSELNNYIKNVESFLEECTDEIQKNKISCFLFELRKLYKSYFTK